MKKVVKVIALTLAGAAMVACSSPKKMAEQAENVIITSNPEILEVVNGKIEAEITVVCPADYFNPKAILEVTPVIVYEGGEIAMKPFVYQGDKVEDNYKVISKNGQTVKETVSFDYVPGMEQCHLELRGVATIKNKSANLPVAKVADGANTTYMLAGNRPVMAYMPDGYQEVIEESEETQILYSINNATVRNSELKKDEIKQWKEAIEAIKADERREITGTEIVAYASPDGATDLNTKLSEKRAASAEKAFGTITKKSPIDAPVFVQSISEDWEGFQELVAASTLEDKDLIIRVLSMYNDPDVREREIKNMSAVYKTLAKDILPQLRRARLIANIEFTNYSNDELIALINDNIDILDEPALLRAAAITKDLDAKATIYRQAIDKYNSDRAQFNLAVVNYYKDDIKGAEAELSKVKDQDNNYYRIAKGALAFVNGDKDQAAEYFAAATCQKGKENLAFVEIHTGKYADALKNLEGSDSYLLPLAYILNNRIDEAAAAITCECPYGAYLKAIISARKGDAQAVKTYLEKASENEDFADRAAKDIEFAQYR